VSKLVDPRTRDDARLALEKYGERVVGTLGDFLADERADEGVRREVVAVLARIAGRDAAGELLESLAAGPSPLELDLVDALDLVRVRNPEIVFLEAVIEPMILRQAARLRSSVSGGEDIVLFKLLGLLYNHEDVFRAYESYRKGTKDDVAYAVELLDEMLSRELREKILPVLERKP
jgi:hypothetical protein